MGMEWGLHLAVLMTPLEVTRFELEGSWNNLEARSLSADQRHAPDASAACFPLRTSNVCGFAFAWCDAFIGHGGLS
jgi:hypothetical protein